MIRVRQVEVDINKACDDEILSSIARKLKINKKDILAYEINKESIDARNKPNIYFIYEIDVKVKNEALILSKNNKKDILSSPNEVYSFKPSGNQKLKNRPIVVGTGPAGLFASYMLAKEGYKPIIIERGKKVEEREKDVLKFWETGILDENSNVQFGEGGAGTFSDGKLNTLIKDKEHRCKEVFKIFVKNGAPKEILYKNKPHIGTDILKTVVKNMREEIINMGGEFKYSTCLTDIHINNNHVEYITVNNLTKINCDLLVLALGHSSRDTFKMLYDRKINMEAKPFAIGIRVQHSQDLIDKSQYGGTNKILGASSYKLTHHSKNGRGVYTFCMCPGGYVVNSSSENKRLVINGMSNYARDSKVANSAVLVTITPNDFGNHPLAGIEYQKALEEKAYKLGKGMIPVQLYKDFKENKISTNFKSIKPQFKGKYTFVSLNDILPEFMVESLKEGIDSFGKKIECFSSDDTVLAAIESRTSSPVRIIRNELGESSVTGIYPVGEGAGYAGGITSAAIDGIKIYECIAKKYKS
jgi:hypothetical protein